MGQMHSTILVYFKCFKFVFGLEDIKTSLFCFFFKVRLSGPLIS